MALPFLNCFLDGNGTALADGSPRRVRFVHWFFGNGITAGRQWAPDQVGALSGITLPEEIKDGDRTSKVAKMALSPSASASR